jgi:hypothetical protein
MTKNPDDSGRKAPPDPPPDAPNPAGTVNQQILDAVQASTEYAFGLNNTLTSPPVSGSRLSAGVAIAYDKVAQATSLGIQDATDYERNVLAIASAAQGKALAMILAGTNVPNATTAFVLALVASIAAPIVVLEVGAVQSYTMSKYPQG